jgi:hypothetical protein
MEITMFDGTPVLWAPGFTANKVFIQIPEGVHQFTLYWYYYQNVGGRYSSKHENYTEYEYEFLPGHTYRITRRDIYLLFFTLHKKPEIKDGNL